MVKPSEIVKANSDREYCSTTQLLYFYSIIFIQEDARTYLKQPDTALSWLLSMQILSLSDLVVSGLTETWGLESLVCNFKVRRRCMALGEL